MGDSAQQAIAADDGIDGVSVAGIAAALVSNLEDSSRPPHSLNHSFGVFEAVGHLLFAVDIQSGFEAGDGVGMVHPVGGGDDYGIDLALHCGEHFAVVLEDFRLVTLCPENTLGALAAGLPDIAHGLDAHAGDEQQVVGEDGSLCAVADDGDIDLVFNLGFRRGVC